MGIDHLSGGAFYADPAGWVLDDSIPVTNPNIFSFGKPGRGKSATTKAFCLRMMDFGYRTLILGDPNQPDRLRAAEPRVGIPLGRGGPGTCGDRVRSLADTRTRARRQSTHR